MVGLVDELGDWSVLINLIQLRVCLKFHQWAISIDENLDILLSPVVNHQLLFLKNTFFCIHGSLKSN